MGSENPTEVFLKVTAELETLKRLIEGVTGAGAAAQKASGEIDKMGEALKGAINPAEIQRLNAELDKLATEQKELTAELTKLRTANTTAAQATAQLKAECQKLALQVDGAKNSAVAWQAESRRVSAEVEKLRGYLASATTGLVRLSDAQNAAAASARQNAAGQQQQSDEIKETASAAFDLRTILALGATVAVKGMSSALVDAELDMNRLRMTLLAAQGDAGKAASSLNYVTTESDRIGVSMMAVAPSFARFSVSANNAGVSADEARRIFTAFSEAAVVLGLSTAETEGVFRALEQMFSKGNVQAEELRGQLGERLPGAFNLSAQALGVTTQQLNKMLEQGQVLASDLVPKLATAVQRQFAGALPMAMNSTQAELNRLNNEFLQFKLTINELGFAAEFTDAVRSIGEMLVDVTKYARENREQMALLGEVIKSIGWALLLAGAAASAMKLASMVATITPLTAAFAGLAVQVTLVNALIERAIYAYGEMRDAQIEAAGQNGRIIAGLIESVKTMKDAGEAASALRQATVQLNAAQAAGDTEMVTRIETIIRLIRERGDAIVSDNVVENERLAILQKQTDEIQKQRDEIGRRVSQLTRTEKEYEKARFASLSPEEQMKELLNRRGQINTALGQPFQAGNATSPDEIKNALLAFRQREMELLTEKYDIQSKIDALDAKGQQRLDEEDRVRRAALEDEKKELDRKRAQALSDEADQIRRVREGRIAAVDGSLFLTDREKQTVKYNLLLKEQRDIEGEIANLRRVVQLEPAGSATKAAAEKRLSAAEDRLQFGIPQGLDENRPLTMVEDIKSELTDLRNGFETVASSIRSVMGDAISGISEGIQGLIHGTMTWGQALMHIGTTIMDSLIKAISDMFAQWLVGMIIRATVGKALTAAAVAASVPMAMSASAIWAAPATLATIATMGGAASQAPLAIASSIGVTSSAAMAGFSVGGYTGPGGVNDPAGIVHKGEVVFSQADISRAGGVAAVEALRVSGSSFRPSTSARASSSSVTSTSGAGGTSAPVINMAFFDSRVSAEKWAASQEGQAHIVDVVQRNLHQISGA